MILTEFLNDGTLIRHYSDAGFVLLQNETGAKYSDPIDIVPCPFTYTETNEKIDNNGINSDENYQNVLDEFEIEI